MEKRVVIAVVLSIAFLYGYSYFFPPPPTTIKRVENVASTQTVKESVPVTNNIVVSPGVLTSKEAKDVIVDTDLYTAVFSTTGAGIKKFSLKKYKDAPGSKGHEILLVNEETPQNFSLISESRDFGLSSGMQYTASTGSLKLSGNESGSIQFQTISSSGISITKTYYFTGNEYRISLDEGVRNTGSVTISGKVSLVKLNRDDPHPGDSRYEVYGPVTLVDNKVMTEKIADLAKTPKRFDKDIAWTAFGDKYFMDAVISENNSIGEVDIAKGDATHLKTIVESPSVSLLPGQSVAYKYRLYFGPKDLEIIKSQGSRLEEVIDFGWFSLLAKPLLMSLKFFYSFTHNYGIAIIIITCILKLIFFPLTHKSYKSMKEMQKLQPKMTELKERYKNDRDALNKAVMELYKTHKVNPLGGCLPMIVQIPVFFALYKALMFSIELRHAPFMFWIQDLSAKDPYYVTPIIMGVTMFVQQKMTPTNMDPVQAKMMLALPVVFTFMFLNFPSGLVLYWLVNNILTIAQQSYINKTLDART